MTRQRRKPKAGIKASRGKKRAARPASRPRGRTGDLEKTLSLIRAKPGIRPSEINRLLNRVESDGLRSILIKRGLVRKEKDGSAMRYYPV